MQITVNPKFIKKAAENFVGYVLGDYTDEAVKIAKIKEKEVVQALLEDAKFLKALEKDLAEVLDEDLIVDSAFNCHSTVITALEKSLSKAQLEADRIEHNRRQREAAELEKSRIEDRIKELEKLGYTVTKN